MNDIGKGHREHSILLEGNQQFSKQAVYGRYEFVQKSAEELALEDSFGDKIFNIHKLTVGTNRKLFSVASIDWLLGAQISINVPPNSLRALYGNLPLAGQVYLQIRPSLNKMKM